MLRITANLAIDEKEITYEFVRASGPGGQNVNKVATAVQLRFNVLNSPSLSDESKDRLSKLAGYRMTQDGVLVIEAKRYRTQDQNRADSIQRLVALIEKAAQRPKIRHATRPGRSARMERVDSKKKRAAVKKQRRSIDE
jgi:ribosome-associated protein